MTRNQLQMHYPANVGKILINLSCFCLTIVVYMLPLQCALSLCDLFSFIVPLSLKMEKFHFL